MSPRYYRLTAGSHPRLGKTSGGTRRAWGETSHSSLLGASRPWRSTSYQHILLQTSDNLTVLCMRVCFQAGIRIDTWIDRAGIPSPSTMFLHERDGGVISLNRP